MLDVKNVTKLFSSGIFIKKYLSALDNVSLHIERGEVFGIVGESGSGKTTLARIMLKSLKPSSGTVYFEGNDLYNGRMCSFEFRRKVQVITQNFSNALNPFMTIGESLKEVFRIQGIGKFRSITRQMETDIFKEVGLGIEHLGRYPSQLSGGQLQRVMIARVIALRPHLIIADEPTSCLDMSVQAQVIHLLLDLKKEMDFTMIFISHDIELVASISDRIAVMLDGRIVEMGSTKNIMEFPKISYTKKLVKCSREFIF